MKGEKTIKEWLMMLKEPYRSRALENAELCGWDGSVNRSSLCEAIIHAFDWNKSAQGWEYWDDIYNKAEACPQDYLEPAANTVKEEAPQPPIPRKVLPRRVMVKEYKNDDWHEAELIADLTQFGISESNHPFCYRNSNRPDDFVFTNYMMEIEDYKKMVEPKKPMSFGEFTVTKHGFTELDDFVIAQCKIDYEEKYNSYQEYLKTFES